MTTELTQSDILLLGFLFYLCLFSTYFLWKRGYFILPKNQAILSKPWYQALAVFLLYFVSQLALAPLLWLGITHTTLGENLSPLEQAELNAFALFISSTLVVLYAGTRRIFRRVLPKNSAICFLKGALVWFLSYPVMMIVSQAVSHIVAYFYAGPLPEQVAVEHLKLTQEHPLLFEVTLFEILLLVPIVEEILFRGYLQGWLRNYMGRGYAITWTAMIFALFHYSASQQIFNIELIASLFVLACYLGFLYEKYQNIWASIGLHSCFNTISVVMILQS